MKNKLKKAGIDFGVGTRVGIEEPKVFGTKG